MVNLIKNLSFIHKNVMMGCIAQSLRSMTKVMQEPVAFEIVDIISDVTCLEALYLNISKRKLCCC